MCSYYKNHLLEGAVEGEFRHGFFAYGKCPRWIKDIKKEEYLFMNSWRILPAPDRSVDDRAMRRMGEWK